MREILLNWDYVGAKLASLSDEEQSAFFIGFAKELMGYDTHYSREMQMHAISKRLPKEIKEILKKYLETIWWEGSGHE